MCVFRFAAALAFSGLALWGQQQLPDGAGRDETVKLCKQCHELDRSVSKRQDRDGWQTTMTRMMAFGMKAKPEEIQIVLDYLAKHYPAEELPRINLNSATAIELESGLSLKRSQAAALIQYREKNGEFKSIEDVKKVPGLDVAKIESKKDRITF